MSATWYPEQSKQRSTDPKNPAQKYYSGTASIVLAVASIFFFPIVVAPAAIITGVVAVVAGGKLDNRKLRGEGWIGIVLASLIFFTMIAIVPV